MESGIRFERAAMFTMNMNQVAEIETEKKNNLIIMLGYSRYTIRLYEA